MFLLTENRIAEFEETMNHWTDTQVLEQVYRLQKLLDTPDMQECCLVDEANDILGLLKDECVWRLCQIVKCED